MNDRRVAETWWDDFAHQMIEMGEHKRDCPDLIQILTWKKNSAGASRHDKDFDVIDMTWRTMTILHRSDRNDVSQESGNSTLTHVSWAQSSDQKSDVLTESAFRSADGSYIDYELDLCRTEIHMKQLWMNSWDNITFEWKNDENMLDLGVTMSEPVRLGVDITDCMGRVRRRTADAVRHFVIWPWWIQRDGESVRSVSNFIGIRSKVVLAKINRSRFSAFWWCVSISVTVRIIFTVTASVTASLTTSMELICDRCAIIYDHPECERNRAPFKLRDTLPHMILNRRSRQAQEAWLQKTHIRAAVLWLRRID